jgi:hypothetical protein
MPDLNRITIGAIETIRRLTGLAVRASVLLVNYGRYHHGTRYHSLSLARAVAVCCGHSGHSPSRAGTYSRQKGREATVKKRKSKMRTRVLSTYYRP